MSKLVINGESYGYADHMDYRNRYGHGYGGPYGGEDGDGCGSGQHFSEWGNSYDGDCLGSLDGDAFGDGEGTAVWANPSLL